MPQPRSRRVRSGPPSQGRRLHGASTRVMSLLMILIGVALVVRTIIAGGGAGSSGIVFGVLFAAAGAARLYLQLRGS
jgi:hypothetical protein